MIFFLHIPKTGGQTLATRLASAFPPGRCSVMQADILDADALARLSADHDFFEGHLALGTLRDPPPGLRVMTVVREPVEQIISHYRHILRDARNPLSKLAGAMPPHAFLERFGGEMWNFQARCLVGAMRPPDLADHFRGVEFWLLRHFEECLTRLHWLVPSEKLDEFCLLWAVEAGRRLAQLDLRVNASEPDNVDVPALRRWLRDRPERFAVDSLLWNAARRRYEEWREALVRLDRVTGEPSPGALAWEADGAAVWLLRNWHPPLPREEGLEWAAGPGTFSTLRVRRGGHRVLRFDAMAFFGVRWDRVRLLRQADMSDVPLARSMDDGRHIASYEAELGGSGDEETFVLHGAEDVAVLPANPAALNRPRRAFATRNWRLA
ncbi:MAG: hypothetical protein AVDCRST_MAG08-3099 [uncultured Acetobacteraceae bacterium]|uniref:Sulfotransferase family protein n=1 Tax=uncultured Acetobacteraceae bacterium TaxID=169975 RepID=A0A6J4J6G2_9PROT|nr:MAG: hypothetical protein AVDCRST_MAG08-3099 [uncultured Acetobacteraceae bacterium]